jgi:hypothetical protein
VLLSRALPGQKAEEKKARLDCLVAVYGSASKTFIESLRSTEIEDGLPAVREWLMRLYREQRVGAPLDSTAVVDPVEQLGIINRLSTRLLDGGVTAEGLVDLYERGAGVREAKDIQPGDYSRVIAALEAEAAKLEPTPARRRRNNGSRKADAQVPVAVAAEGGAQ